MITKEVKGKELYVWIWIKGLRQLLYKRWIDKGYGMVMDRQAFTAKDTESFKDLAVKAPAKTDNHEQP